MKGLFTPKQLALLAVIFFKEDETFMPVYEQVAINARKFIDLGDPWTDESLLVFIQKSMESQLEGKLKDVATLKYYLSKIAVL
jgi:hypothetical protein